MLKQTLGAALTGLCLAVSVAVADDTPSARGAAPAAPVAAAVPAAQAAADISVQLAANPIPARVVALATAHPAKFPDAIERAIGARPRLPAEIAARLEGAERFTVLENDAARVAAYIADRARAARV